MDGIDTRVLKFLRDKYGAAIGLVTADELATFLRSINQPFDETVAILLADGLLTRRPVRSLEKMYWAKRNGEAYQPDIHYIISLRVVALAAVRTAAIPIEVPTGVPADDRKAIAGGPIAEPPQANGNINVGADKGKDSASVASAPNSVSSDVAADVWHSLDFRSARWYGLELVFTVTQSQCVAVLWRAWECKTPAVAESAVLEEAESSSDRLRDVFNKGKHPAWGTMIQKVGKDMYRLAPPDSSGPSKTPLAPRQRPM